MPYCLDSYGESNLASLEQQWDDLGDDPREILNFLNNSKNNITLGFVLRRYLCKDAARKIPQVKCTYLEQDRKYRFEIEDKNGMSTIEVFDYNIFNYDEGNDALELARSRAIEQVKEYKAKNYKLDKYELEENIAYDDILYLDVEKYVDLFMIIERHNNGERKNYRTLEWVQRQDIRNYLKQEECKREILYRIAFALGMDYPIFSQILASVSSDGIQRPDPRRMEEIVYVYCLRNKKNTFMELDQVMDSYDRHRGRENDYTRLALAKIHNLNDEKSLFEFLDDNAGYLIGSSRSAYRVFDEIQKELVELFGNVDEYADEGGNNARRTNNKSEFLRKMLVEFFPDIVLDQKDERKKADSLDKLAGNAAGAIWEHRVRSIKTKILSSTKLSELNSRKKAVTKHQLVLLYYFNFITIDENLELEGAERVKVFFDEMNEILEDANMPPINITNKFENFLLCSLNDDRPGDFWKEIILEAVLEENRQYELLSYKQGNYEECLRYLELSESALREEEFRMPWQQLWIRHDRGVILAKMGKQEAADNSLEQAGEFYLRHKEELDLLLPEDYEKVLSADRQDMELLKK